MQFHFSRTPVRQRKDNRSHLRAVALLAALFMTLVSLSHLGAIPALAIPPEPIPEPPDGEQPYQPPDGGFDWSRPSRFALAYNAWIPDTGAPFAGHYDPAYVNPTSFSVRFDGCRSPSEERAGTSTNTYIWTLHGNTVANNKCRYTDSFPTQGTFPVSLKITAPDGSVVLDTVTHDVVVKDLLIVALGDSYASGEGNPDQPQVFNYVFGVPVLVQQAVWWDSRCHRSMAAPSAQAAWALERMNPQLSVTYLSFACSGATINRQYFADAPSLDPYAPGNYSKDRGTGILGPYAGTVPPDKDRPQDNQLPSQVYQLISALNSNAGTASPRQIDALILSGGGNDIGFGNIAGVCTLYWDCPTHLVSGALGEGPVQFRTRVQQDLDAMPGRYTALANVLGNLNIRKAYITEYPDSTRDDSGGFCGKLLDDVIPGWMQPFLALLAPIEGQPVPLVPFQIDRGDGPDTDEVAWAGGTVLPGLNAAVAAAANAHGWTLVNGIADANGNLFSGHGYCASDSWIRRASDATVMQGPWDSPAVCDTTLPGFLLACVPPATTKTTGTLHPTARGYQAVAGRIYAKIAPDLVPNPGPQPTPPTINPPDFSQSVKGANGWLTGHVAGVTCPAGAANCTLMQQAASVDASTTIAGTGLSVNGANTVCPSTPTLLNGVICSAQVLTQTVAWSFAFPNDGLYHLEFSVSAHDGAVGGFSQEVKVDLNNPTTSSSFSTPTPASGWFNSPMTVTLGGADGLGSGVQSVQYQLDGGSAQTVNGNAVSLRLGQDGMHTFAYQVKDFAGRSSAAQSLTVKLDQTPPAISISAPTGSAYLLHQVVAAGYACTDGGSGVATCAGPVANNANIDTASPGTKSFTVNASDNAGNTSSQSVVYRIGYNICALFDQSKAYKAGSTVPVKLQLCDAGGANVSASTTVPVAMGLTQQDSTASSDVADAGNANPDSAFRYDATLNGYIYNLSTAGLSTGTWVLSFSVPGDPVSHSVHFDVR